MSLETFQMLIDGAWVAASDGQSFESLDPASNAPWALIPEATEADVDAAVKAAHRAQTRGPWAEMTPSARGKCLARLGDLLAANSEALGRVETREDLLHGRGAVRFWQVFLRKGSEARAVYHLSLIHI